MAQTDPHFKIRMPAALKARLEKSAKKENRSITAEIIYRLEESYKQGLNSYDPKEQPEKPSPSRDRAISELTEEIAYLSDLVEKTRKDREELRLELIRRLESNETGLTGLDIQFRNISNQLNDYGRRLGAATAMLEMITLND